MNKHLSQVLFFFILLILSQQGVLCLGQEKLRIEINGQKVLPSHGSVTGVWFFSKDNSGSQVLILGHSEAGIQKKPRYRLVAELNPKDQVVLSIPIVQQGDDLKFSCSGFSEGKPNMITSTFAGSSDKRELKLTLTAGDKPVVLHLNHFIFKTKDGQTIPISLDPVRRPYDQGEVTSSPDFRPALTQALIEWDWRMSDGIETPLEPRTFCQALEKRILQGDKLLVDLKDNQWEDESNYQTLEKEWLGIKEEWKSVQGDKSAVDREVRAENLWLKMHQIKRKILLANPLFGQRPILFAKHVPGVMSHQLTQVYGYSARPGGGLFVLEEPGKSMKTRLLSGSLPIGNYMHPEVSFDGKTILFAFCNTNSSPTKWRDPNTMARKYHLYSMNSDGSNVQQLTTGDTDNFSPTCLPDGSIIFSSTQRGGYHRCGGGPCFVYTLTKLDAPGKKPYTISWHETQEWNPAVLHDGRIIYTRWDYVDRDAVYYQNLWTMRQDGTDVRIFYGNNTFNPCGIWESQSIPGSNKVMAVGAPHHGMSAGSIILIDNTKGVDGSEPITRLTPEVLYPEGEVPLPLIPQVPEVFDFDTPFKNAWQAGRPADRIIELSEEQKRWPVHCFKSPWPCSEKYFIVSYSFDKLLGEAGPNIPNQFGIYYADAFGNRELIYRDPNISSVWAKPLTSREVPPAYRSTLPDRETAPTTGNFFLQNVYESWPVKIKDKVHSLRLVQVLPKTTPNANLPKVGEANASPGKQVLGTVPVEEDGSAFFQVPAKTPLLFQALDKNGRMIQGMRSLVYLQPGETASCTGCHEDRMSSVPSVSTIASKNNKPSTIKPGPDGSLPLSYPIMVQPVLDRLCIECHNDTRTEGKINLTKSPEGAFSKSYNALVRYTAYSAWGMPEGNHEPMTLPDKFGARASRLTTILENGHYNCKLTEDDWNRLNTWMDANALFYGTFNIEDQKRQLQGERIKGAELY